MLSPTDTLRLAIDPGMILRAQGIEPDPWQVEYLTCPSKRIMLNCCRGAGKSRTTSARALHHALFTPNGLVLIVSRAQRQAQELLRYVKQGFSAIGRPVALKKETETQLEFGNGARVVSLPGKEANIRSYQGVTLLIIDEAARVGDDLYGSVSPMTGVKHGTQILLSTPFGQRGFFFREWHDETAPWTRFRIPWQRVPRYDAAFIGEERRKFGESWVEQEFECSFASLTGLVYPDFPDCIVDTFDVLAQNQGVSYYGGLDWGWNDPACGLWGFLDKTDVLHISWEVYKRQLPIFDFIGELKRKRTLAPDSKMVNWAADPSGPAYINACRQADLKVRKANNDIRLGLMAVTARVRTGRIKVLRNGCPNLISESQLYRYPSKDDLNAGHRPETPVDSDNHAMDALRYLVVQVDRSFLAKLRKREYEHAEKEGTKAATKNQEEVKQSENAPTPNWNSIHNPDVWETL